MNYPNILVTTSLSDNRVLFDEPTKYVAKLRELKSDNNLQCVIIKIEFEKNGDQNISNFSHRGKFCFFLDFFL